MTAIRLLIQPVLWIVSLGYYIGLNLHRRSIVAKKVSVPVISIGNITTGGTGKTPAILNIIRIFADEMKTSVITRGYGRKTRGLIEVSSGDNVDRAGDEALLIKKKNPAVTVIAGANRYKSAKKAIEKGAELLVLDDGFQSWEIERDLDIIMIDCTCPFGGGLLPYGRLREPVSALSRAEGVVLNRSNMVEDSEIRKIEDCIKKYNPDIKIFYAIERIKHFKRIAGEEIVAAEEFAGSRVLCFSGIGNPAGFYYLLNELKVDIIKRIKRKDHYIWTQKDIDEIIKTAASEDLKVLTTEKDAARLPEAGNLDAWTLVMELEIRDNENWMEFIHEIKN
ncbi:tetraacyldisaccharide 4'-kinase [Elusimicrobiota bacterium]